MRSMFSQADDRAAIICNSMVLCRIVLGAHFTLQDCPTCPLITITNEQRCPLEFGDSKQNYDKADRQGRSGQGKGKLQPSGTSTGPARDKSPRTQRSDADAHALSSLSLRDVTHRRVGRGGTPKSGPLSRRADAEHSVCVQEHTQAGRSERAES